MIVANLEASESEDLKGLLETVHTKSQGFGDIKDVAVAIFDSYDLKNTLVSFDFIAEDEEYAYAKVRQKTEKIAGPEFKNNEIEILHVLKKENGEWKFWSQAVLSSNFLYSK